MNGNSGSCRLLIPFGAPAHRWLNISFVNAITDFIPLYSFAHNWIRQHKIRFEIRFTKFSSTGVHKPLSHTSSFRMKF